MIDNICKFLAESFSEDFASWILGKSITLTKLEPSELSVEPIRADSVIFLESSALILHIEFQTEPNKNIPLYKTYVNLCKVKRHLNRFTVYFLFHGSLKMTLERFVYSTGHLGRACHLIRTNRNKNSLKPSFNIFSSIQVTVFSMSTVGTHIDTLLEWHFVAMVSTV